MKTAGTLTIPAQSTAAVRVLRWRGGTHPTEQTLRTQLQRGGVQPYLWTQGANFRRPARSHAHERVLCCVEGSLEVSLPDLNQRVVLRAGDCLELPRNVRYALTVGERGARCLEGEKGAFVG
ncbi:MAG: hypothetical protein RML95_14810 [Anaerolineae bacterium]|nr:hypothetical protein [Anaerolineae bacterium]MDW8300599.1 hypothetical protein [Anaerolineae bacterium]